MKTIKYGDDGVILEMNDGYSFLLHRGKVVAAVDRQEGVGFEALSVRGTRRTWSRIQKFFDYNSVQPELLNESELRVLYETR